MDQVTAAQHGPPAAVQQAPEPPAPHPAAHSVPPGSPPALSTSRWHPPALPARRAHKQQRHQQRLDAAALRTQQQQEPDDVLRRLVQGLAAALPVQAGRQNWQALLRVTQLLLFLTQHAPGSASMLIAAHGTSRIQGAIQAAAAGSARDDPAAQATLQHGTALLLQCVQLSEGAADLVVETASVRLLLQLLLRQNVNAATKRSIGGVLQALAATKLVYRDVLHGAGIVDALLATLTDAAALSDLVLLQELLWVLVSLADDDEVYKDDMRAARLPDALVALFSVYAAHQSLPELRPVAAQVLRCLALMAAGDEAMAAACDRLGLLRLLLAQLTVDIHQLDEPPLPAAASNVLTINSLPTTPKSPHITAALAFGSMLPASSPLKRSGSGSSSPRPGSAGGPGGACSTIPEDQEAGGDDGGARQGGGGGHTPGSSLGGRGVSFANHSTEAAALRALGGGPTPLQRLSAALLLREVLAPVLSRATIEVLLHGLLLPAVPMQLVGPRLSLAFEATCTLQALLEDSSERAAAAAQARAAPLVVQLLLATNLELASTAASVLTLLVSALGAPTAQQGELAPSAVRGLTELLRECATHTYPLASSAAAVRRLSSSVGEGGADGRRRSSLHGVDSPMSPIPETNSGGLRAAAAEQAAGTVWAPEDGSQDARTAASVSAAHQLLLVPNGSGPAVLRHPSLDRSQAEGAASQLRRRRQVSSGGAAEHLTSRQRPHHNAAAPGASSSCLVCQASQHHEACSFCYLSCALRGLVLLLRPQPELQAAFAAGAGLEVVVGLLAGLASNPQPDALLECLCAVQAAAVAGNCHAQDQVRLAGGIDVLAALLHQRTGSQQGKVQQLPAVAEVSPAAVPLLQLLAALVRDNSANKLALRESGAFSCVVVLLDVLLRPATTAEERQQSEVLAAALLQLLSACLPDSPGSQLALHQLGATSRLLQLMRTPDNSPRTGLSTIHALALLANTGLPAAQAAATAGGLVAVVMNVLQQQAMAGVLVSEVCMTALPSLLDGNPAGKQQALHYGMLPLLVHLLRSSPSPTTLAAAAHSLAVLAVHNSELQGQVTAAGGLSALMDRLDPEAAQRDSSTAAQAQAALAAAAAAAAAAAEAVAMAAQASADGEDGNTGSAADTRGAAQPPVQDAAAAGPQHVAATAIASASGSEQAPGTVQDTVAASAQRLAFIRVQAACLHAVAVLAHDNSFTKNTARQQGIMALLRQLLASGAAVLQAAVMAETSALTGTHLRPEHQQQQWQRPVSPASSNDLAERPGSGAWPHASLRVRTPRAHAGGAAAAQAHRQEQQQEQRAQLHVLAAAVHVLAELCHGNHSNQQAAGAEGLIDQLVGLAAGALGSKLATAARHSSLLASACDALAAAVEFCNTSKLAAREAGAVDVCSRLLLMVTEVPDVSGVLMETRLQGAVTAACGAVAALAQDCEDNQAAFARCPGFVPALFRLLGVGEPTVAYQAARALEFVAVRADIADDAEDRPEFEAEAAHALVGVLSRGAVSAAGSGRLAAARAAVCGSAAAHPPSAAVVRQAAALLALVVDAAEPAAAAPAPQQAGPAPGGRASSTAASRTSSTAASGLGTAPAHPMPSAAAAAPAAQQQQQQQQPGSASPLEGAQGSGTAADGAPLPSLPAVVMDHTSGLAVLRSWSLPAEQSGQWQQLVGRSAPAFQRIRAAVGEGPWAPLKQQVCWLLLLLAAKSASNRALLSRLQRATLTPLALQLENAERFAQHAAAVLEDAPAAGEPDAAAVAASSNGAPAAAAASGRAVQHQHQHQHSRNSSGSLWRGATPPSSAAAPPASGVQGAQTSSSSHVQPPAPPHEPSASSAADTAAPVEDDELAMLRQEVAFLGLMDARRSSSRGGGGGD